MQIDQPISTKQQQRLNYMDCHTHLLDYPTLQQTQNIIQSALKQNVNRIVVNTTTTAQFTDLLKLLHKYPNTIIGGFGIHPYFLAQQQQIQANKKNMQQKNINTINNQQEFNKFTWLEQLQTILKKKNYYSVGQIGLDFRKIVLQKNPKQLQMYYFKTQLDLAIRMGRPATIHCVRAHGQMLKIFKDLNKNIKQLIKPNIIMHSYGGSEDITKSMIKLNNLNIFFSLCLKRSAELCNVIPIDKIIFQTDSPCQNNIELLKQQNRLHYNTYYQRTVQQFKQKYAQNFNKQQVQNNKDKIINNATQISPQMLLNKQLQKLQTNQPLNVISNIKSCLKYYKMDQLNFTKKVYQNSLRAFKLIK